MASHNFNRCLAEVLRHEGGYADHPRDPGGATNMGITRKTLARWRGVTPWWSLSKHEVRRLTRREAQAIYRNLYWKSSGGDHAPPGLDLALFDFAVNSGPGRAVRTLQRLIGVRADGLFGPVTSRGLELVLAKGGPAGLVTAICNQRLGFLSRLSTFPVFGRGWRSRVASIRKAALAMAGGEITTTFKKRTTPMDILSGYKTYIVGAAMLLAGIGQLLGVDLPGFGDQSAGQLIMEGLAIVFLRKGIKSDISNA